MKTDHQEIIGEPCLECGKFVAGYVAVYCCNGFECGCMGQPTEPCLCEECWDKKING